MVIHVALRLLVNYTSKQFVYDLINKIIIVSEWMMGTEVLQYT